jgi:hypothetical protein
MKDPFDAGGGTAFPLVYDDETKGTREIHSGMTLRDWFAGKAMQGLLADRSWQGMTTDQVAEFVYFMADAMLKERSKE